MSDGERSHHNMQTAQSALTVQPPALLCRWLCKVLHVPKAALNVQQIAGDASPRRYFRVSLCAGSLAKPRYAAGADDLAITEQSSASASSEPPPVILTEGDTLIAASSPPSSSSNSSWCLYRKSDSSCCSANSICFNFFLDAPCRCVSARSLNSLHSSSCFASRAASASAWAAICLFLRDRVDGL